MLKVSNNLKVINQETLETAIKNSDLFLSVLAHSMIFCIICYGVVLLPVFKQQLAISVRYKPETVFSTITVVVTSLELRNTLQVST